MCWPVIVDYECFPLCSALCNHFSTFMPLSFLVKDKTGRQWKPDVCWKGPAGTYCRFFPKHACDVCSIKLVGPTQDSNLCNPGTAWVDLKTVALKCSTCIVVVRKGRLRLHLTWFLRPRRQLELVFGCKINGTPRRTDSSCLRNERHVNLVSSQRYMDFCSFVREHKGKFRSSMQRSVKFVVLDSL